MKRTIIFLAAIAAGLSLHAQGAQNAAAAAAQAIAGTPKTEAPVEKPQYWTKGAQVSFGFTNTTLTNWAAGGYNTMTFLASMDGSANYKKDNMFWNNRLLLDYGFIHSADKPVTQKNNDRINFESKWGKKLTDKLNYSATFNLRSQFSDSYKYNNPGVEDPTRQDWLDSRVLQSGFFAPAYTDIGFGIDWVPAKWISINFAPLTGGFTFVRDESLRAKYGMELLEEYEDYAGDILGSYYKSARFEFGAKMQLDASAVINDVFTYKTQLKLFSDYLDKPQNMRVNWDNQIDWKFAKHLALTFKTFLIYDDKVRIDGARKIQFQEYLMLNFTYAFKPKEK